MLQLAAKHVFYPLWDLKERADRLAELRRLQQSQFWPRQRLEELQLTRVREIVAHASKTVPFYRRHYAGIDLSLASLDDLRRLPTVSKHDVREHLDDLVSEDYSRTELEEARTGGSTGRALTVLFDKTCQEHRNAAAMRSDAWAGRDLGVKTAAIWGNPPQPGGLRERFRNAVLNRLVYLDTMALNEDAVREFATLWRRHRPQIIFGHSHSIFMLARFLSKLGIEDVRPLGIISTSMMLLDNERAVIEEVFRCPVTNRYGCEEVGLIAAQCPLHSGMHINSEHVIVELLRPDGSPAATGEEGEVVVTELVNRGMPLIRYKVEDMALASADPCPCGRGSPVLKRVVGRVADFLVKKDGTLVAGVSLVERTLTRIKGLDQMQLVQESLESLVVNVVPGNLYSEDSKAELQAELAGVFGADVAIDIRLVQALSQDRNGKYRFSISKVERR